MTSVTGSQYMRSTEMILVLRQTHSFIENKVNENVMSEYLQTYLRTNL